MTVTADWYPDSESVLWITVAGDECTVQGERTKAVHSASGAVFPQRLDFCPVVGKVFL
jgi:hypothetical protein